MSSKNWETNLNAQSNHDVPCILHGILGGISMASMLALNFPIVVDSNIRTFVVAIDGSIRIPINEALTLNNFCIQYPNHTFFGALEFFWSC